MGKERIVSREYKLLLKPGNFTGDESSLVEKTKAFWQAFKNNVPALKYTDGFDSIAKRREIRFYDTTDFLLKSNNYVFRYRKEIDGDKKEITLKYRHADRYISQDRDMLPAKIGKGERKFEEDIKASFQTLYSFSSCLPLKNDKEFKQLKDIAKLYPGIKEHLDNYEGNKEVVVVNELVIREIVVAGAEILICEEHPVKSECALILWYDGTESREEPIIVEFSFRYGGDKEKFNRAVSQSAYDLFLATQKKLATWIDQEALTKTALLYRNR